MPFLEISPRLKIHYEVYGDPGSPAILLLHGLGATGESWGLQTPELVSAGWHVITPDARGFGQSTYPGGGMSIASMADDFARLLTYLNVQHAIVVGISMGGTQALQLALDHPELVEKLVLVNTFASLRPDSLKIWGYFLLRFLLVHTVGLPAQARQVAGRIFPHPDQEFLRNTLIEQILQADPAGYRAAMRALGVFNIVSRLSEIKAPTMVVTSSQDTTVPPRNQQVLVDRIPGARKVIIPGAGHAVTAECPEEFNRVLFNFLGTSPQTQSNA